MNEILALVYGYARALWRRRWWAVIAAWGVCVLAWIVVLLLPDRFEATARVYVDAKTPLSKTLEDIAIDQDFASQLTVVKEALLSRPQLEAVARKTNLDAHVTDKAGMDALVSTLQEQIQVVVISTATTVRNAQPTAAMYTISYQNVSRQKSIEVVRALLDSFVEGTLSSSTKGSGEAQGFLVTQIKDVERRLADADGRLAAFKRENVGLLPGGEKGDYIARLEAEMGALTQAQNAVAVGISRRDELRRQLATARQFVPGTSNPITGASGAVSPDLSTRILDSEKRLEELLLRFTDRHPEVIALRQTIEELKAKEAQELAVLAKGGSGTGQIRSLSVNPVYQQIQMQLNQVEVEIASLRGGVAQHEKEVALLKRAADSAPEVEKEFTRLSRDYSVLKASYEQLVARLEQAKVTDNAAQSGIVRFDVIEPPRAGIEPVWPKRSLFMAVVLILGVGAGVAIALLPHLLRPTFDNTNALARTTALPVLGAVSQLRRPNDAVQTRREAHKLAIAAGVLVVVGAMFMLFGNIGARAIQAILV